MSGFWELLDTCSPLFFYAALGSLLVAFAILERVAQRGGS